MKKVLIIESHEVTKYPPDLTMVKEEKRNFQEADVVIADTHCYVPYSYYVLKSRRSDMVGRQVDGDYIMEVILEED